MSQQYVLTIWLDLTNEAPDGAGWYVGAFLDKQAVRRPQRVSGEQAVVLADAIQQVVRNDTGEPSPTQIVSTGNKLVGAALQTQLEYAEAQARRIAQLRRTLAAETGATVTPTPPEEPNV